MVFKKHIFWLVFGMIGIMLVVGCDGGALATPAASRSPSVSAGTVPPTRLVVVTSTNTVPPLGTPPTQAPTSALTVTQTDTLTHVSDSFDPTAGSAFLSPDGSRIATLYEDSVCIYNVTDEKQNCTPVPTILYNSIRWSPDSRRLVYTEDWEKVGVEPDIWTIDATTGTLTDLTDAGVSGKLFSTPSATTQMIDVAPNCSVRQQDYCIYPRDNDRP